MKELNFDIGLSTYTINGKDREGNVISTFQVMFNPADETFFNQLFDSIEVIEKFRKEYDEQTKDASASERFEASRSRDEKIMQLFDDLFRDKVSDNAFDKVGPYAISNGFPVWLNISLAIMDEILENLDEEEKNINPRIKQYTEKYSKYTKKYHK